MTSASVETTTIEQTVHIAASPEIVWRFWTDAQRMVEWWGERVELVYEVDGLIQIAMANGYVMRGSFREFDPPNRLVFTFGWEQNQPGELLAPGSTTVEVVLTADGDGTLLSLRHFDMPTTHAPDHTTGWTNVLAELQRSATAV